MKKTNLAPDNESVSRKFSLNTQTILSELTDIPSHYCFRKVLGHGRYGRILLWESLATGHRFAIKAINKKETPYIRLMEEIKILAKLDHPNIVKYFRSLETTKYFYVLMEYCPGGNLFDRILKETKFSEVEARVIIEDSLRALNYCYHLGIVHRDIKPENLMYSEEGKLKIIDFGLSMLGKYSMEQMVGSKFYIAPEVIKSSTFTPACDIWALGIVLHILLSGYVPIVGETDVEIYENIKNYSKLNFGNERWSSVSNEAKDLLNKMMDSNYTTRITAADALNHPWFTSTEVEKTECNPEVLKLLKKYGEYSELKKKILNLLVKSINESELKEIHKIFLSLDKEKTGMITCDNLKEYLKKSGHEMTAEELERITKKANHKGEAFINYSEFIAAVISTQQFLTEAKLWSLFNVLDARQEGSIANESVQLVFKDKTEVVKLELMKKLKKNTDTTGNITFEQFKCILLN